MDIAGRAPVCVGPRYRFRREVNGDSWRRSKSSWAPDRGLSEPCGPEARQDFVHDYRVSLEAPEHE